MPSRSSGRPQKFRRNANCRGWRRSSASPKRRNSSPSSTGISSSSRRRRITNSTTWWISGPPFPDRTCAFSRSTPAPVHMPSRRSSSIRSRGSAVSAGTAGTFGRAGTTTSGSVSSAVFRHSGSAFNPCARTHGFISECHASYGSTSV